MFPITKTYKDFNGDERTETFFFNMTKAELMEMELGTDGGMAERLKRISAAKDKPSLIKIVKDIVLLAYGEKSDDGRHFLKSDSIRERFQCTQAYSDIFMEIATDDKKALEFMKGIMPSDVAAELDTQNLLANNA